jgi:hypothetical protein
MLTTDPIFESAVSEVQKFHGDIAWEWDGRNLVPVQDGRTVDPFDIQVVEHNALVGGGASNLWQCLIGNGTATAGQALTYFNNAQAAIGVGDSTTAVSDTQTNLQGAASPTNRIRKAMDATYPLHTDGANTAAKSIVFRSTFATTDANFAWNEWGVFNSVTDATGRMLQRVASAGLGTKTSAATWVLTVTLSLA